MRWWLYRLNNGFPVLWKEHNARFAFFPTSRTFSVHLFYPSELTKKVQNFLLLSLDWKAVSHGGGLGLLAECRLVKSRMIELVVFSKRPFGRILMTRTVVDLNIFVMMLVKKIPRIHIFIHSARWFSVNRKEGVFTQKWAGQKLHFTLYARITNFQSNERNKTLDFLFFQRFGSFWSFCSILKMVQKGPKRWGKSRSSIFAPFQTGKSLAVTGVWVFWPNVVWSKTIWLNRSFVPSAIRPNSDLDDLNREQIARRRIIFHQANRHSTQRHTTKWFSVNREEGISVKQYSDKRHMFRLNYEARCVDDCIISS